jgi:hypothetical protein
MKIFILTKKYKTAALILLIAVAVLFVSHYFSREYQYLHTSGLISIRTTYSDYKYFHCTFSGEDIEELTGKHFKYIKTDPVNTFSFMDYYTLEFLYKDGTVKKLHYHGLSDVFYASGGQLKLENRMAMKLREIIIKTNHTIYNTYGKLIPWDEVNLIFPILSNAKVIDFMTGKSFHVQRRAGACHADVQPLTAYDTSIMKEIYGGKWSWDRRSVIIEIHGYRIAASMNGMPHGHGKIQDNNFNGHFCIHFLNSTTHSGNMDRAHHIEILKAAGKLPADIPSNEENYIECLQAFP